MLSSYFLFLGWAPSITRAWITILIALLGLLLEKRSFALNSLGVALLVTLFLDPFCCQQIGFQFSFIVTASILLFHSASKFLVEQIWKKRPLSQMVEMSSLDQHGYYILSLLREAFALAISVNLTAFPIALFYFNKFPLMSLVYNLFFPFMVSISMLLLLLGILFSWSFLGYVFHAINNRYTEFMLNFTYNLPTSWDITWRISSFPLWLLTLYLCLIFSAGILCRHYLESKKREVEDFVFI